MPYIMCMMVNVTAIAGFTFLAYHFNHWWIALFSLLFMFGHRKDDDDET